MSDQKNKIERSARSFIKKGFFLFFLFPLALFSEGQYAFVTATDTEHYSWTLNLIAGIHRYHEENCEIAVFDLGLSHQEKQELNRLAFVKVHEVKKVNPLIFEKFVVNSQGKIARGLYSWKPVVLKQASDLFPYFFYIDSGISIKGSLAPLFTHLEENGSFLIDCGHNIGRMTTKKLKGHFALTEKQNAWILKKPGLSAGFQGISSSLRSNYIDPIYHLAYDLSYFEDDGSCPKGFGWARHDQTLFSIQAQRLNLPVHKALKGQTISLRIQGKERKAKLSDFIKITRGSFSLEEMLPYLKHKEDLKRE